MKNLNIYTLVLLVFVSALQANAQNKSAASVVFRATRFDPADRPPPEYVSPSGSSFKVPMHNISTPIKATLRDGKYLDLRTPGSDAEKPAHSVAIPESMRKNLLLIFVPSQGSYAIIPVHAPVSRLGGGSRLVVNATGSPLAIKYGNAKPLTLQSTKQTILESQGQDKMTPILISIQNGDTWKLVRSEKWPNDRRFRSFVFVYKKPNSTRIAVHAIPDRIQAPQ